LVRAAIAALFGVLTPSRPDSTIQKKCMRNRLIMIPAHKIDAILTEDGKLALENLPFFAGDRVEVIVLSASRESTTATDSHDSNALRGSVLRYDDPLEPVAFD
jgi:hypothetical protein